MSRKTVNPGDIARIAGGPRAIRSSMLAAACAAAFLAFQPPTPPARPPGLEPQPAPGALAGPGAAVTRADVTAAYMRLEATLAVHAVPEGKGKELNRFVDTGIMALQGGNPAGAIARFNEAAARLETGGDDSRSLARRAAESLKVEIEPEFLVAGAAKSVTVSSRPLYRLRSEETTDAKPVTLTVTLVGPDGKEVPGAVEVPVNPAAAEPVSSCTAERPEWAKLPAGRYLVWVRAEDSAPICAGSWTVVAKAPSKAAEAALARLARLRTDHADLGEALDTCRSRIGLLTDNPSPLRSAEWTLDPVAHAAAVNAELDAIGKGEDPYRLRGGDWWVGIGVGTIGEREIPCRFYCPQALTKSDAAPAPLVIALHGPLGDESLFMDAHGAGLLRRLADEHGFIVAAPGTPALMTNLQRIDTVIAAARRWYSIDRDRIYVVGHSNGAGAAATLATLRSEQFAAVCCLAGGARNIDSRVAPLLFIAGDADPVFAPGRLKGIVDKAVKDGRDVELRTARDCGHTLLVSARLGEAVDWLLAHKRGTPPAAETPAEPMDGPPMKPGKDDK